MAHVRLRFTASDRAKELLAARKAQVALGGRKLLRAENVDARGHVYFDVEGEPESLRDIVEHALGSRAKVEAGVVPVSSSTPDECLNCGNVPDEPAAKCPACDFVEVSLCPSCNAPVARTAYISVAGSNVYECPKCQARVALRFADPLYDDDGNYRQPVVDVVFLAAG